MRDMKNTPKPKEQTVLEVLSYNEKFIASAIGLGVWALVLFVINLSGIGGGEFTQLVNAISGAAAAALLAYLALRARGSKYDRVTLKNSWRVLHNSIGLWAGAEILRLFLSLAFSLGGQAWLWLFGYLPIFYGLRQDKQEINLKRTPRQLTITGLVILLGLGYVTVYGILPPLQGNPPPNPLGNTLGILYTLIDLALISVLLTQMQDRKESAYTPLGLLAVAFGFKIMGNLAFGYAGSLAAHPLPLALIRYAHAQWYLPAILFLVVFDVLLQYERQDNSRQKAEETRPNATALIFSDGENRIIKYSVNYRLLAQIPREIGITHTPLQEALGLAPEAYQKLQTELQTKNQVKGFAAESKHFGKGRKIWINAVNSYDAQHRYTGVNMVVRAFTESSAGMLLTIEEQALADSILVATGEEGEETDILLARYFNLNYKTLARMVIQYEGSRTAVGMTQAVNRIADKNHWSVRVLNDELNITGNIKKEELSRAISELLLTARGYVAAIAGTETLNEEIERINRQTDRSTKKVIEAYGLGKF